MANRISEGPMTETIVWVVIRAPEPMERKSRSMIRTAPSVTTTCWGSCIPKQIPQTSPGFLPRLGSISCFSQDSSGVVSVSTHEEQGTKGEDRDANFL